MTSVFVIAPYLDETGTSVFDDAERELAREPFVSGIPEIIEFALNQAGHKSARRFKACFSDSAFLECTHELTRIYEEAGGHWYNLRGTELRGWLCPALLRYYSIAPENIFIRLKVEDRA